MAPNNSEFIFPSVIKSFLDDNIQRSIKTDNGDWIIDITSKHLYTSVKIPIKAQAIGYNQFGDYIFLLPNTICQFELDNKVYIYRHDEDIFELYNKSLKSFLSPPSISPSDHPNAYYYGGAIQVKIGDVIYARDFFFKKTGRVAYLPGVSLRNIEFEHDGMAWIGIRFDNGRIGGAYIDPSSCCLKKSVKFIRRCDTELITIKPQDIY